MLLDEDTADLLWKDVHVMSVVDRSVEGSNRRYSVADRMELVDVVIDGKTHAAFKCLCGCVCSEGRGDLLYSWLNIHGCCFPIPELDPVAFEEGEG